MTFAEKLSELNKKNVYPLHMPGHKRQMELPNPYSIDITEIDGYDNLHAPEGMIRELEDRVSRLYDEKREFIERSYVLVNGSTCGILSAISAVTKYGGRILMGRNSHKSAYNALCIRGLDADYLYPENIYEMQMNAAVTPEEVRSELAESADIAHEHDITSNVERAYLAVYVTSPTYEGIVSDIEELADIAHEYNIPLIVDEAHGAHFGLAEGFPDTAIRKGADIVIQSIHKTLMGMTQTAILHLSKAAVENGRVDVERLEYFLRVYQSSSPSYVLMASVDECVRMLEDKEKREKLFAGYRKRLENIHNRAKKWKDIHFFEPDEGWNVDKDSIFDYDSGKLVIYSERGALSGKQIYDILRDEYAMQPEMSLGRYCLAMTSCMDTAEGFDRLADALEEIDSRVGAELYCSKAVETMACGQRRMKKKYTVAQAFEMEKSVQKLAEGMISGDYGYVYPPGIPFIVPGEVVTKEIICDIINASVSGYEVHGVVFDNGEPYMKVLKADT